MMPGDLGSSFGGISFDAVCNDLTAEGLEAAQNNIREYAGSMQSDLSGTADVAEEAGQRMSNGFNQGTTSLSHLGSEVSHGARGMTMMGHSLLLLHNYAKQTGNSFGGMADAVGLAGVALTTVGSAARAVTGITYSLRFATEMWAGIQGILNAELWSTVGAEIILTGGLILAAAAVAVYAYQTQTATSNQGMLRDSAATLNSSLFDQKGAVDGVTGSYKELEAVQERIKHLSSDLATLDRDLGRAQRKTADDLITYNGEKKKGAILTNDLAHIEQYAAANHITVSEARLSLNAKIYDQETAIANARDDWLDDQQNEANIKDNIADRQKTNTADVAAAEMAQYKDWLQNTWAIQRMGEYSKAYAFAKATPARELQEFAEYGHGDIYTGMSFDEIMKKQGFKAKPTVEEMQSGAIYIHEMNNTIPSLEVWKQIKGNIATDAAKDSGAKGTPVGP